MTRRDPSRTLVDHWPVQVFILYVPKVSFEFRTHLVDVFSKFSNAFYFENTSARGKEQSNVSFALSSLCSFTLFHSSKKARRSMYRSRTSSLDRGSRGCIWLRSRVRTRTRPNRQSKHAAQRRACSCCVELEGCEIKERVRLSTRRDFFFRIIVCRSTRMKKENKRAYV